MANTTRHAPKNTISSVGSTGGSREKSLISRNRKAGIAIVNTNRVSQSAATVGQRPQRISAKPTPTSRKSGAVSARTERKDWIKGRGRRLSPHRRIRAEGRGRGGDAGSARWAL